MIRSFLRAHPLLRFLALNLAFGVVVALLALGGLMALDVHGLRHLVLQDQSPLIPLIVLALGFIVTFASSLMGTAIMALGETPSDTPSGTRADATAAVPHGAEARVTTRQ